MQTIEIKHNNVSIPLEFASEWNELNKLQLIFIAKFWEKWRAISAEGKSLMTAKTQLLLRLIGKSNKHNKLQLELLKQLDAEQVYEVAQTTNFVFENNTLTNCPLPIVSVGFRKFYAPDNGLENIIASEFAFAEANFFNYHKSGNIKDLELLIATIYRPFNPEYKKTGIKRLPFIKEKIDHYQAQLKKLSYEEKQLIYLWYIGCRMSIVANFPSVFSSENQSNAESSGWISIIMAMAGDKFGAFEQTSATDLHLLLLELKEMNRRASKKQKTI